MIYLDSHCMTGAHYEPRIDKKLRACDILNEMDLYGIDEAFVYHSMAREYDVQTGNSLLLEEIKGIKRLHPSFVLGLHHNKKLPPPREYISFATASGVRLFRLFFGSFISESVHIDMLAYEELFRELQERSLPVMIEFESAFKLAPAELLQLDGLLENFKDLPVILSSFCYDRLILQLIPRMERFSNLHLISLGMHSTSDLPLLIDLGFRDRIIFGSGFPWQPQGVARIALEYASVSDEDKAAIAYDNLASILRGVII